MFIWVLVGADSNGARAVHLHQPLSYADTWLSRFYGVGSRATNPAFLPDETIVT